MTEFHADNLKRSLNGLCDSFYRALESNDSETAKKAWLKLLHHADIIMRESVASRIEADALAAELQVYRPTRSDRPPAPLIDGHAYVFTARTPWVCVAVELRQSLYIQGLFGRGYHQEHVIPERTTLCGKKTTYPVSERFESGGWPRLRELCPECTTILVGAELLAAPPPTGG